MASPEHLAECPGRQAPATRGRAHAVPDVAAGVVKDVPQREPTKDRAVLDDPPERRVALLRARRTDRVRQVQALIYPCGEALG